MSMITHEASSIELTEFPIAADQITAGNPVARIWISAQTADLKVTHGVWDCSAGDFAWDYTWDEFAMILEGEAVLEVDGATTTIRAGDCAHMPIGTKSKWHVPKYIKKTFVLRTVEALEL